MSSLPDLPHILVSGSSSLAVEPDFARITAQLKHVENDVAVAKRKVDEESGAIIQLAKDCGIQEKDITATQVHIGPEHEWRSESNKYIGTAVDRNVNLVLRDLNQFSRLLQGLAEAPVFKLSQVKMDTSDRDEWEERALTAAIQNARKTADKIASGLDLNIKGVYRASEGSRSTESIQFTVSSSDSFEIGTIRIYAAVEIIFEIDG